MYYYDNFWSNICVQLFLNALREILLVELTKRSQLYILSKRYQKFCETYQYSNVKVTKYTTELRK